MRSTQLNLEISLILHVACCASEITNDVLLPFCTIVVLYTAMFVLNMNQICLREQ